MDLLILQTHHESQVPTPEGFRIYNSVNFYEWDDDAGQYKQNAAKCKDQLRHRVLAIKPVKKDYSGDYFAIEKEIGPITLRYSTAREVVCEAKVVGKRVIPAYSSPEREVDEIEWVCNDSLLGSN